MSNRPKPTALKLLQGNPGKRKINAAEPKPCTKMPSRPQHLNGAALHEWNRITKYLEPMKMVTPVDRAELAAYCDAFGEWVDARREVQAHGTTYVTANGNILQSPHVGIAHKAMELMHKFSVEFGFTPASRAKLTVPQAEVDEMTEWENRAKEKNAV